MIEMSDLPDDELRQMQMQGAAMYLRAYVHRMARALEVEIVDDLSINGLVLAMVEPLNYSTEAAWHALVRDIPGMEAALEEFGKKLNEFV